jgi:hypothetical protein
MGLEFRLLEMPRKTQSYRFGDKTVDRLRKLGAILPTKTDTAIIEDAVAHLLATLESDDPRVHITAPSDTRKGHKTPRDAA